MVSGEGDHLRCALHSLRMVRLVRPIDDLKASIGVFHQSGQAFHPVAVIGIQDTIDIPQLGMVDMPAHDAIRATLARLAGERSLKVPNEAHRAFDFEFQVSGQ